ncbi:hypothetical protein B0H11DRAFT_2068681 [Mycena galericulata]|nr:hypothetical protein B0H11DRAFT_2068681 [Mycena galericulata]
MAGWLNAQLGGRMTWRRVSQLVSRGAVSGADGQQVRVSYRHQGYKPWSLEWYGSVLTIRALRRSSMSRSWLRMARSRVGWLCRGTTSLFPRMYASLTDTYPRWPCTYKRIDVQGMSRPRRGHLPGLEQARVRADSEKVPVADLSCKLSRSSETSTSAVVCRWKKIRCPQKFVASSSRQCARVSLIGLVGHSESMDPPELIKDAVPGH